MVRANALFIVIVISLVMGILCSSLIGIAYYQRLQVQKNQLFKKLENDASSGLNVVLADRQERFSSTETTLDLFGDGTDSVSLKKTPWGVYEVAVVNAFSHNHHRVKSVLIGSDLDEKGKSAIYLSDQNSQLALAGNTVIKGTCYLPEAGVKRAYIEGVSFSGSNLINGTTLRSEFMLPPLNDKVLKPLISHFETGGDLQSEATVTAPLNQDTMQQSFFDPSIRLNAASVQRLTQKVLEGNIVLVSDKPLEIDSSCKIDNIIVVAPAVVFHEGFRGSLQVFCTDSIIVRDQVFLKYPSVLGLIKTSVKVKQPVIMVGQKAVIKGVVFTYCHIPDLEKTIIRLGKESRVEGQVYSDGGVDLQGTVYGNITCSRFTLRTPSSIYENHILNGVIDSGKLSEYYVGSSLVYSKNNKKVVKWLE